jgi:acetoin:2,6-dichlorophenolindophenol oxidoreductase subunit alpha
MRAPRRLGSPLRRSTARTCRRCTWRQEELSLARARAGPTFLNCHTYRFHGHHVGDVDRSYYRSKEEEERWRDTRDPLKLAAEWVTSSGHAPSSRLDQIDEEVQSQVRAAVEFALNAPYPELSEVTEHVYA